MRALLYLSGSKRVLWENGRGSKACEGVPGGGVPGGYNSDDEGPSSNLRVAPVGS